jgi:valyl-tRNA synthetase
MKLDPKARLDGVLYSRSAAFEVARAHAAAIQKLGGIDLELRAEALPHSAAAIHSTPEFDLVLNVPRANVADQRKRLEKEREQLEKNIANSTRQLGDEKFLSRAPAHVIESIRAKMAEYETQLQKVRTGLNGLSS